MNHELLIDNVTVSYNRIPAVHHVSVVMRCGTCVGLVGPNGAGKSTFIKAVAGLLPLETGSIRVTGHGDADGRHAIAYVPQREAVDWDFPITVRALIEMGRYPHVGFWRAFRDDDHAVTREAMAVMELDALADRQIKALSGGQQQRAFLARAWAQKADIYLLDEPFTGLDNTSKTAFARALHKLRDLGKLIIVSHHALSEVPDLFDRVLLMNGELVAYGETASTFTEENLRQTFETRVFTGTHS